MARTDKQIPPAGWAWDPSKRHEERFWDGAEWTGRVRNRSIEAYDPVLPRTVPVTTATNSDDSPQSDAGGLNTGAQEPSENGRLRDDIKTNIKGAFDADTGMFSAAVGTAATAVVFSTLKAARRRFLRTKGRTTGAPLEDRGGRRGVEHVPRNG